MVVEVVINSIVKSLNKTFDYCVPAELIDSISVGSRVLLPFGFSKQPEEGFVVAIKETSEYMDKLKDVISVQDEYCLSIQNIELAKWMASRYFCNVSDCIKMMLPPGTSTKVIQNRVTQKVLNFVYLKKDEYEILQDIEEKKKIKSDKQIRALKFLLDNNNMGVLTTDLEVFADVSRAVINTLVKNGYIEIVEKQVDRNSFMNKNIKMDTELVLTKEQENAFDKINKSIIENNFNEFLLYGVTGSGKTEVYLQLIGQVIRQGKSAIMLVPEISLTPQMVNRFIARFGEEEIAVLHSKLSVGERFDQWNRIKSRQAKIIIGARSAIFAPVNDLGLIIMDEEHDSSYKSEMTPRYNAREVARYLARQNNIPLVYGSATPDLTTFYKAQNEDICLLKLSKRANNSHLPDVEIVDLKDELTNGNKTMISVKLYNEIKSNIEKKRQTILFLNRRGFSTFIMCRECGYTAKCKNCNIALTYHIKEDKLKCHYCGYEQDNISICPECGSNKVKYFGTGTQKLEAQVKQIFKDVTTIRMDIDTITKKNSHEEILTKFKEENINILIGTQMVVKGHHFPNVTLVGVIAADGSLNIDDYRASERTFQILTQVAGRAGRENLQGKVVVQTYNPDNFSIECAQEQDYEKFYNTEIILRKQLKYPPFCDIILVGISSDDEEMVQNVANKMYELLKSGLECIQDIFVYRPMPAPIDRIKNRYRWRIILKGNFSEKVIEKMNYILERIYKAKIGNTRIVIDVNPMNMA